MNAFTIKDIENLSGIKAHTIRIWEQRYEFLKPQRTDTNIRYYSNEELKSILNVALLNKYGYKISHISKMNHGQITENLQKITNTQAQQEQVINLLIGYMVDLRLDDFEAVLTRQIADKGLEKVIDETIFPFLERIGILWLTNNVNPAQEHLVTNLIRQKFIVGIENSPKPYIDKTAILFLPEGEFHELGLIYVNYLFRQAGVHVLYLGANVPVADLEFVVNAKKPALVYTHLSSLSHKFKIERFISNLKYTLSHVPVIASGSILLDYESPLPTGLTIKKSLQEVKKFILHFGE